MDFRQKPDGTAAIYSDQEGKDLFVVGGPASITGVTTGQPPVQYRGVFTVKIPLSTTGQGTAAALATWQNTTPDRLIVGHTYIDITTAQTPTCFISVGVGGSALSIDTILIDSLSCNATGVFDNITEKGTAGKSRVAIPANSFVNVITSALGSATSVVGIVYLDMIKA
jgi:hypothetical protein